MLSGILNRKGVLAGFLGFHVQREGGVAVIVEFAIGDFTGSGAVGGEFAGARTPRVYPGADFLAYNALSQAFTGTQHL